MRKITLLLALVALLLAPKGLILAQDTGSSTTQEKVPDYSKNLPKSPLDDLFAKWFGGNVKDTVQEGMIKAQKELEALPGKAADKATEAAKAELERQAKRAAQGVQEKTQGYVGGVVEIIKQKVADIIGNIKLFFADLFSKK